MHNVNRGMYVPSKFENIALLNGESVSTVWHLQVRWSTEADMLFLFRFQ